MRHLVLLLAGALAVTACDPKPKAAAPDPATNGAEAPAATNSAAGSGAATSGLAADAKDRTSAPTAKEDFDKDEVAKASRSFRKLLNDGRGLVKSKKYAEGVEVFMKAHAIDPNHARLLSELGWAHFRLEQYDAAEKFTRSSIANSRDDKVRGASLYNLGRIHEARKELDQAATAYSSSLAVRPGNAIVQKRLDDLTSGGASVADANATCIFIEQDGKTPKPTPADACAAYYDNHALAMAASAGGVDMSCLDSANATAPTARIGDADVVTFKYEIEEYNTVIDVVAILRKDGWFAHEFNEYDRLGNSYNGTDAAFEAISPEDVDGDGKPELALTYHFSFYDGDYSENTVETYDEVSTTLVDVRAKTPTFQGFFLTKRARAFGAWLEEDDLPKVDDEVLLDQASAVSFADAKIVVADVAGKEPATPAASFAIGAAPMRCYHAFTPTY
jgi:tetratricopeptide (TPR) repeat protein